MKKFAFCLVIATGLTAFSCKKSYQCDCNHYNNSLGGVYSKTSSSTYKERKRSDAQSACSAKSFVTPAETVNCVIVN